MKCVLVDKLYLFVLSQILQENNTWSCILCIYGALVQLVSNRYYKRRFTKIWTLTAMNKLHKQLR